MPTNNKRSAIDSFQMPAPVKITGRTSTITNSFVNSIVPSRMPTNKEVEEALHILHLNADDLRCAYCGDPATEWDHLRPLVRDKRPTGFISEIANLVPACGKCNQSKGKKDWEAWMTSSARKSPTSRNISGLDERIKRLRVFEQWRKVQPIDFEGIVGPELWAQHWKNNDRMHSLMRECQEIADRVREKIASRV